jgi:hypothetical protein
VNDSRGGPKLPVSSDTPGTWRSVIDHQTEIANKSGGIKDGVPYWAVAEAEEVSLQT